MKSIILIISILISNTLYCQEFEIESVLEMLEPKNIGTKEPEKREQILLHHFYRKSDDDSLKIYKTYKARYLANHVLEFKSKKKASIFWETRYYWFDRANFFWDCKKNGKVSYDTNFRTHKYEYFKIGNDSIVIDRTIDGNATDSLCQWLDKFIYRNGLLEEKWHKYGPFDGCDWQTGPYKIEKYSFLDTFTTKVNFARIDSQNQKVELDYYCIKKSNPDGKDISREYFNPDDLDYPSSAYYWIYHNDRLMKIVLIKKSIIFEEISFQ